MKLFIPFLTSLALFSYAGTLAVDQPMIPYTLNDQHGETHEFSPGTRMVIISFEKKSGKMVNRWLKEKPAEYLGDHRIDFIVEISGMPKLISKKIALPKMRKYRHLVLVASDKHFEETYPREKTKLTVILLGETGIVKDILFVADVARLEGLAESP